jgi:hypothetical protein
MNVIKKNIINNVIRLRIVHFSEYFYIISANVIQSENILLCSNITKYFNIKKKIFVFFKHTYSTS